MIFQTRDNSKAMTISGNASGMTGTIYAPAAQLAESGNAPLNAALIVDTLTISGNGVANTVTLNSPSGTVAYTPAQIRAAYGISSLSLDGTGQTIAIVDAYDDPSIFQAARRLRLAVRPDRLRADALCPVRAGVVVPDRPQPVRPGHRRCPPPTRAAPAPTTGSWRRRSTSSGPTPSPPGARSSSSRPTASRSPT